MDLQEKRRIAVVGGGVAGITAAYLLSRRHDVTLFERNDYLGGHTNTVVLTDGPDQGTAIDTGFIVLNNKTYPNFHKLLAQLQVPVRWSDMSFAFFCERSGLEYAGTTLNGLFSQRKNIFQPAFYSLLKEIVRFGRCGSRALLQNDVPAETLGEFVRRHGFTEAMVGDYLLPMGAAIWSAPTSEILKFPAVTFLRFFQNHGLLGVWNRPKWQTVIGGSFQYVIRFRQKFSGDVRIGNPVVCIERSENEVNLRFEDGATEKFSAVVLATHADEALQLLGDPSVEERRLLGTWRYQKNPTVLHTDARILPRNRRSWASWNYRRYADGNSDQPVTVTYHMNRLQGLQVKMDYFVSLNLPESIRPSGIVRELVYTHPVFDQFAIDSQMDLSGLNGRRHTWFCGSYFGYGFHEDAVKSAVAVGKDFGIDL